MSQEKIKRHLAAQFMGRGAMSLLAFLATPFYLALLGVEMYGLIAFSMAVTGFFSLFDLGLGDTLCREIASLFSRKGTEQKIRDTLRTLESLYWVIGGILTIILYFASPWLCEKWLTSANSLSPERLTHLLRLMALSLFFLWPFLFYCKGLQGLQSHWGLNLVFLISALVKYGGGVWVLYLFPTAETFFYWQILSSCFQTVLVLLFAWKKTGLLREPGNFSFSLLRHQWKFSLGMSGIGITSILFMHMDRILISKLFSLKILGIYSCAYALASSLYYLLQPILAVYYPLFVRYSEQIPKLTKIYHQGSQVVALLLFPVALLLIFFSKEILFLWSHDSEVAMVGTPLLITLTMGILLSCLFHMPLQLQVSKGWTRLTLLFYTFSLLLLVPFFLLLNRFWGLSGGVAFYAIFYAAYLILIVPRVHKKILGGENGIWFREAVWLPLVCSLAMAVFISHRSVEGIWNLLLTYGYIGVATAAGTALSRNWFLRHTQKLERDGPIHRF